jgi:DNA-binding GntR family transcriptional regulator
MLTLQIETVEERVFHVLRTEIVRGTLIPDSPLRLEEISKRLGVSTTPVRAALRRLEAEHLVKSVPHRGATVASIDLENLQEIQSIRAALEGYASRLGAERVDDEEIGMMEAHFERLTKIAAEERVDEYLKDQWRLHDICYAAGVNSRLLGLIADHRRQAERYLHLAIGDTDGFLGSVAHQERLLAACRARDGRRAEQEIHDGLDWTVKRVAKALSHSSS